MSWILPGSETLNPVMWESDPRGWLKYSVWHTPTSYCECERCNKFFAGHPGLRDVLAVAEYIEESTKPRRRLNR
jgi:hypothetical protein